MLFSKARRRLLSYQRLITHTMRVWQCESVLAKTRRTQEISECAALSGVSPYSHYEVPVVPIVRRPRAINGYA